MTAESRERPTLASVFAAPVWAFVYVLTLGRFGRWPWAREDRPGAVPTLPPSHELRVVQERNKEERAALRRYAEGALSKADLERLLAVLDAEREIALANAEDSSDRWPILFEHARERQRLLDAAEPPTIVSEADPITFEAADLEYLYDDDTRSASYVDDRPTGGGFFCGRRFLLYGEEG